MSTLAIVGIDVILLILLLMLSVPLPYCFGGALLFISIAANVSMKSMMLWAYSQSIGTVLLASPLFILAGTYMGGSGVAKKLLDLCDAFVGRIKGGLGVVSVITCAIIGAISGSGFTGVAATGPIMIPRMVEQGYSRGFATALVTVSSVLGLLIPPSAIMIIYGWITETSILACFLATVGPGILVMILFCVINLVECRKFDLKLMPPMSLKEKAEITGKRTVSAIPALMMPVIILGGIYCGVFTPTEAAAVAAIYSIPVGLFIYRAMKLRDIKQMTFDSICSIGSIMVMIVFCLMLSQTFVMLQVPQALIQIIFNLTTNRVIILILMNLFLFLVGMIVNDSTGMLLCAPLLLPLVRELGISPIHFSAIMGVNLAMGGVTPPYASILYLGMRIGKCEFQDILKPAMKLLIFGYVPVVFLTSFWPELSMFLPKLFGFA
ncbi:sialic acid TRAP transporter permease protein SiaT [Anaerotignum neopropionicum]|uniref:Sialic acid TRAP transporter permease protein SiaT n=1 Tax=Anaerotignum neopropionicum TaxID=36847 RepID=A0A136WIB4_9FIRM|nr:TRAP transporter large permease [Anaerotignum neopropionicum]KXL54217.1 sialic acid TRAP transporter permease protein SiaT [Anaerotignum neopropionicum]KXL54342.1 sialic acid TRAP transporter permease protein SiaT [Anaerotignum neopropionicum]